MDLLTEGLKTVTDFDEFVSWLQPVAQSDYKIVKSNQWSIIKVAF